MPRPARRAGSGPGPGPRAGPRLREREPRRPSWRRAGGPSPGLRRPDPAPEAPAAGTGRSTEFPDGEGATLVALGEASGSIEEGLGPEPGPVDAPSAESVWGPGDAGSDEPPEGPVWF